jgi:Zn finger protein HypA/HybF involved in hydrogenase expression
MILKCTNCNHELETPKNRVRCPECKKHALEPVAFSVVEKEDIDNGFTTTMTDSDSRRVRYDEDGNVVKTYTRTEQIGRFKNQYKATDEHKEDTENFDKKIKYRRTPRDRKPAKMKKVYCARENCNNSATVPALCMDYYICPKCVNRRRVII